MGFFTRTMQSSSSTALLPDAILEWLYTEMGYRPLGSYASSTKASMPNADSLGKVCRGNMIPVWSFLLKRVKSEKTVDNIRRNILVHCVDVGGKGRSKEKLGRGKEESSSSSSSSREMALRERELAEKEVERLRQIVRRQRKELKARMIDVSREEAERKRMIDERSNYRHKQVMLEAYDQQCDEAAKIFAEYHKHLRYYVSQAKDARRSSVGSFIEMVTRFHANNEKGSNSANDVILIETAKEKNIRKVCESLAEQMSEKNRISFPANEGRGINVNPQLEAAKLGIDTHGDLPTEIKDAIAECLNSPPQLLQVITSYTQSLKSLITTETDKIDNRADAEALSSMNGGSNQHQLLLIGSLLMEKILLLGKIT